MWVRCMIHPLRLYLHTNATRLSWHRLKIAGNQTALTALMLTIFFLTLMPPSSATPTPAANLPGAQVSFHASGFLPTDTTCTISSPSSPNLILNGACVIQEGTGIAYGGFIIGNVLPGEYVIQITGNQGDFAQTVLSVE